MERYGLLIVDDEQSVLSAIKRLFEDDPYDIYTAQNAEEGLKILKNNKVHVVISDEKMPGMSGNEFLSIVKKECPNAVRIMLTGHANMASAMKAINEGEIYRFFTKPWDNVNLKFAVRSAVERYDLEEENRRLLKIIKQQAVDLKLLEKQFPGITELERDENGMLVLSDISDDEMAKIIEECESKF
jgi:DNA-binding NtrC family response regulator